MQPLLGLCFSCHHPGPGVGWATGPVVIVLWVVLTPRHAARHLNPWGKQSPWPGVGPRALPVPRCPAAAHPLPSCLGQFYSNGGHSGSAGGGGGGGGGSGYGSYYQGESYTPPVPPKHTGKKQPHGGQQKAAYGAGYQSHPTPQPAYSQSQYSSYGPAQAKHKGYGHGHGQASYSAGNSYGSPGASGADYSYESKFSECLAAPAAYLPPASRAHAGGREPPWGPHCGPGPLLPSLSPLDYSGSGGRSGGNGYSSGGPSYPGSHGCYSGGSGGSSYQGKQGGPGGSSLVPAGVAHIGGTPSPAPARGGGLPASHASGLGV